MKKIIMLGLAISITIASCKKKGDDEATPAPIPAPTPTIGAVPTTFTKKVMVEEMTGAWCGWCVLGADGIKKANDAHPGKVNAVAIHGGSSEPMAVPEYNGLLTFANATGVPHYRLNRGMGGGFPGSFTSNVASSLLQVAECGIAIDAKASSGNSVSFTVHAGFKTTLTGDYRLLVYLIEDSVKGTTSNYNQVNYVAGNSSYTTNYYYTQPDPITNYSHKHVARKLLSATLTGGDQIPSAEVVAGHAYKKTYTYTIPTGTTWNTANLRVVAGILKYNATCANQSIVNSQSCKLGALKNWD